MKIYHATIAGYDEKCQSWEIGYFVFDDDTTGELAEGLIRHHCQRENLDIAPLGHLNVYPVRVIDLREE